MPSALKIEQEHTYDAEREVWRIFPPSPQARELLRISGRGTISIEAVAKYLMEVRSQPWFQLAFPGSAHAALFDVVAISGGTSRTRVEERVIEMGSEHRKVSAECEWVCLHELAHLVSRDASHLTNRDAGHGHAFRTNYVLLVRKQLGYRQARYLRTAFREHEVGVESAFMGRPGPLAITA